MTLPRRVEAVVFDMDGLLVDTESMFRDVMMEASRRRGVHLPVEVFLRMVGLQHEASRAVAMAHFGEDFDYEPWIADAWALSHARHAVGVALKEGVVELLDYLEAAGIPRAVATSSGHPTVTRTLEPHGLLPRFQTIVAAGDYARGKPNPDPFLTAADRLGVDPAACLALEDSHNGVRAAHAAGMMTIMVPDLLEATQEMRSLCVAISQTLHEVRALLEAQRGGG
ncbi:MAG: hydrolase, haloacid dehalogenase-like family [Caulobacteraceae bacterium]|jgi:HAD superfamily hydrolase (TIGR01509 family)|nr:hydrolase, haloacid dehalogenase-like family [Caulobacteraceae bacterium]